VYHALKAAEKLEKDGISTTVIDMFTLKPFDKDTVIEAAKNTKCILSVEEHSIFGGLGAAITEVTSFYYPTKVKILGIPDENAVHGKPLEIFAYYGLDMKGIYQHACALLADKMKVTVINSK
jgi:transketolase